MQPILPNKDIRWNYMIFFVVEVFSFCIELKCFCSDLWNKQSTAHFCPCCIASHHRYTICLLLWAWLNHLRQVKRNLMALLISTKKVMWIISELKIVSLWANIKVAYWRYVFNVHKPGLYSVGLLWFYKDDLSIGHFPGFWEDLAVEREHSNVLLWAQFAFTHT